VFSLLHRVRIENGSAVFQDWIIAAKVGGFLFCDTAKKGKERSVKNRTLHLSVVGNIFNES